MSFSDGADHDDVGSQGISKCSTGKAKKECVGDTEFVVSPAQNEKDQVMPQFERYNAYIMDALP